jgi:fatty acid desaturase
MDILAKLEDVYLNILRVVVLGLATLALLAVILGVLRAIPYIPAWLNGSSAVHVSGGSLVDWVSEKRQEGVTVADADANTTATPTPPAIKAAAQSLVLYGKKHPPLEMDEPAVEGALMEKYAAVDAAYQEQYADNLQVLLGQLQRSTGTPLTIEQINQLLDWQVQHFVADAKAKEAQAEEKKAASILSLEVAGGGFVIFLMIIFFFLIVKIERNLRPGQSAEGRVA